jgi:hypothetical protein
MIEFGTCTMVKERVAIHNPTDHPLTIHHPKQCTSTTTPAMIRWGWYKEGLYS